MSQAFATPNTLAETDALIAGTSPVATVEPIFDEVTSAVDKLKVQLAEAQKLGNNRSVATDLGSYTVPELLKEVNRMSEELDLSAQRVERSRSEESSENLVPWVDAEGNRHWRERDKPNPPLLDEAGLEKLHGLKRYTEMTPKQRAQGRDVRESDLQKLNLHSYFGQGSDATKASELYRTNPTVYKLLQARARKLNLI